MSSHWETAKDHLLLTTTNVCQTELKRHERENNHFAPDDSREYRLHHGSKRALAALDSESCGFSTVTVVGVASGADAGERSLEKEIGSHAEQYQYVALNDAEGRRRLRRKRDREDLALTIVPPTYLLYILYDNGQLTKQAFCEGCEAMMKGEGWTNAGAVHAMWEEIPVDCSGHVDDRLLTE